MERKNSVVRRCLLALSSIGLPLVVLSSVFALPAAAGATATTTGPGNVPAGSHKVHIAKVIPPGTKRHAPAASHLDYYGGPVMHQQTTYSIFWLPPGATVSAGYISTINQYLSDVNDSPLLNVLTQYPDTHGAPIPRSVFGGTWTDTTPYPTAGTYPTYTVTDADIQGSVSRAIAAHPTWQPPGLNTMYFVLTGSGVESCTDTGATSCSHVQYCAYHGNYRVGLVPVIYANMPYNVPDIGCGDSFLPAGDPDAMVQISTLAHEQFEAANDPLVGEAMSFGPPLAWYDTVGGEIGDLCNQIYPELDFFTGGNVTLNGNLYRIQGMWSNAVNDCAMSNPFTAFVSIVHR